MRDALAGRRGWLNVPVKTMTRDEWLTSIRSRIVPVGDCMEWTGPYSNKGLTPIAYCPRGYLYPDSAQERRSLRSVLWTVANGMPAPGDQIIRAKCGNYRCVHEDHWLVITRAEQPREQSRRGELQTPKAARAKMETRRKSAKLTAAQVREIRYGSSTSKEAAAKHGVSAATVNCIRRGKMWREHVSGASVFTWDGRIAA